MRINGEKLRNAMYDCDITQAELAKALGIDRSMISYWITGKRKDVKCGYIHTIATMVGVDAEYFTDGAPVPMDEKTIIGGVMAILVDSKMCPGGDCDICPFVEVEGCYTLLRKEFVAMLKRKGLCE